MLTCLDFYGFLDEIEASQKNVDRCIKVYGMYELAEDEINENPSLRM